MHDDAELLPYGLSKSGFEFIRFNGYHKPEDALLRVLHTPVLQDFEGECENLGLADEMHDKAQFFPNRFAQTGFEFVGFNG